ncbi:hypothetical protein R75461_07430 [Paraburkholderia nemoris]|nr:MULTISPECIES: hypothetical protein [Paraburkholderia]CAE6850140.1 hypothetical protein R75461_07430 [Paraburkholderia nemoris]
MKEIILTVGRVLLFAAIMILITGVGAVMIPWLTRVLYSIFQTG